MPDYTDNSFRAAIKALEDVVTPALDPSNPLAAEQLRLVTGLLRFLGERRGALPAYEAAELAWYAELAEALADVLPGEGQELRAAAESARGIEPDRVAAATSHLATLASQTVRDAASGDEATRRKVERTVVEMSGDFLDLKRAWFMPFGFEAAPDGRPSLEGLLARYGSAAVIPGLAKREPGTHKR